MSTPAQEAHRHALRVRYAETDGMGVAHHSAYIAWLEEARIEWLRSRGVSYRDLESAGVLMPVIDLHVRYRRPFRFDDQLVMSTTAVLSGRCSIEFTTQLLSGGDDIVHATGSVTVTAVDPQTRPMRLSSDLLEQLGFSA